MNYLIYSSEQPYEIGIIVLMFIFSHFIDEENEAKWG